MRERPLTVYEAAEYLSISVWQVRKYIRDGLLKAYKLGGALGHLSDRRRYRIWEQDLIDFVNRENNNG